ncbi:MAG: hydrolase [Firmicutes bacterium]|nr:hydrolase [Bacillota bacterium]
MDVKDLCDKLSIALSAGLYHRDRYNQRDRYSGYFSAAVLVPLILENNQLHLLFEVRSSHLSWQPGEICFPGGRIEATDSSLLSAAVRETTEELGLAKGQIQVLGSLYEVVSPIGVRLSPYVGYITDAHLIKPSPGEVSEVFTVPLEFLLTTEPTIGHMERGTRPLADFPFELLPGYSDKWKSRKNYEVLFYKYNQYVIWGLTARVLHNFLEIYKENLVCCSLS